MNARRSRERFFAATLIALAAVACSGARETTEIRWDEVAPRSGTVDDGAVRISAGPEGGTFPLIAIGDPAPIGHDGYAISGDVRYEDVQGQGYVEMWSVWPDGSRFYSRTLDVTGPLAALSGSSDWRGFLLPFSMAPATPPPARLEVNIVLPGSGTVEVSALRLGPLGTETRAGLWGPRGGGWIGAAVGIVFGTLGALIGWLASKGRARSFVMAACVAASIMGVVLLAVGAIAWIGGQPYDVTYPLLLTGVLLVTIFGTSIGRLRRMYAAAELRRMRAMDTAAMS